jgi:predicted transcriptional regulator of viral defense system
MRTTDAYGDLLRMGRRIVTTAEAATRWRVEEGTARRRLRSITEAGLARRLRRGLWTLDPEVDPFVVAPFLTAPLPAYVSFSSALHRHGLIEQIPRQVSIASLDRSRRIVTSVATYAVHHLAPGVFGGFRGSQEAGYVATPEKAMFDSVYIRAAAGSVAYFPELSLPRSFDASEAKRWAKRIESPRLRTLVNRRLREVLSGAEGE